MTPAEQKAKEIHSLKTWMPYFQDVLDQKKNFEIRINDREFKVGDWLDLHEYDSDKKLKTGRRTHRIITYMLEGGEFGLEKGYCILGISTP